MLLASSLPALADARTEVLSAAVRCESISDPRAWLDCYYGAAQPMRAQLGLPPAAAAQVRLVPPAAPGAAPALPPAIASNAAPPPPAHVPRSEAAMLSSLGGDDDYVPPQRMASYQFDKSTGYFTVTLADGQAWHQIEQSNQYARWSGPASNYVVSIVPGVFGSHMLRVSDGHSYRVDKVKSP